MTEQEKRENGLWYDANYNEELGARRRKADDLSWQLTQLRPGDRAGRAAVLRQLFPHMGERVEITLNITTDYGDNCFIGDGTYINRGAYLMDCARITIGKNCFIGPNCGMYTAIHPTCWQDRNTGLERCEPITIGENCWLGGDVTILPGVTIGAGSIIGAGSVVTKDIPAGVVAVGNPCRVLRPITEAERIRP